MKKTEWRLFAGGDKRVRAQYGFHVIGNQAPYWSVTGETQQKRHAVWIEDSFGCLHDEIAAGFPEIAPTIRWHLASQDSGPMHYEANGIYWWEHYICARLPAPYSRLAEGESASDYGLRLFKQTVVFGAVENESIPPLSASIGDVRGWLRARLPALMARMKADLAPFADPADSDAI